MLRISLPLLLLTLASSRVHAVKQSRAAKGKQRATSPTPDNPESGTTSTPNFHIVESQHAPPVPPEPVNVPTPSRPGLGRAGRRRFLSVNVEEEARRARKRATAKRAYEKKRRLGNSSYFTLRPEQSVRWVPPDLSHLSNVEIKKRRKAMLGFKFNDRLPVYASRLPWVLLEKVDRARKEHPEVPLEEIIRTEQAQWEEEMRQTYEQDQVSGRDPNQIRMATKKAVNIHHAVQSYNAKLRSGPANRKKRPPSQFKLNVKTNKWEPTELAILQAIEKGEPIPVKKLKGGEVPALMMKTNVEIGRKSQPGSSAQAVMTPSSHREVVHADTTPRAMLPFDLNEPASEEQE